MSGSRPSPSALPGGLPAGVIELSATRWREAEANAARAGLRPPALTDAELRQRLVDELTAPLRLEDWPAPNQPRAVTGGWVNDEVIEDDREALDAFLGTRPTWGPEEIATSCQELRWPITPYRPLPRRHDRAPAGERSTTPDSGPASVPSASDRHRTGSRGSIGHRWSTGNRGSTGTAGPLVLDLTTHWAGPLATGLLADTGAEVIKVDPASRPDGFRDRPALYRHLNGAKQTVDLDLRVPADRERFEGLVGSADLLVESFSRRVLPNLGYDTSRLAAINPDLAVLSLKAFPAGTPEADWLAYGPGVHAASGLGWPTGSGLAGHQQPKPAPVAYPDLVAGVTAFASATALLAGAEAPDRAANRLTAAEVSLAGSIGPLVCAAVATNLATTGQSGRQERHG